MTMMILKAIFMSMMIVEFLVLIYNLNEGETNLGTFVFYSIKMMIFTWIVASRAFF